MADKLKSAIEEKQVTSVKQPESLAEAAPSRPGPAPIVSSVPVRVARSPAPSAVAPSRADRPPTTGFALLVDGRFKQQFEDLSQSQEAGNALLKKFPNLKVEVYDAVKRMRISL